jgi:hypothetical protein
MAVKLTRIARERILHRLDEAHWRPLMQLYHRRWFASCLVTMAAAGISTAAAAQGVVTGVTMKPVDAAAGTAVTATATGSSPCGAVHIDWGDGAAITYATSTLPVTQSHVYERGGAFTVRAQGMGNCTGEATARVTITGPPPPPPGLKGLDVSPPVQTPRTPVTIALQGTGSCRIAVDFGDGNSQDVSGALPMSLRHTYPVEGKYTITATPAPPCGERRSASLTIGQPPAAPRIAGIDVARVRDAASGVRAITVNGTGQCAYTLDFGDGNSEGRNAILPDVVRHNYPAEGQYTIAATPAAPCTGGARSVVLIGREGSGRIARVEIQPRFARPTEPIAFTIAGSGTCRLRVDLGDGRSREMTAALPHRFTYRYPSPGDYEVFVRTEAPCAGDASGVVRIRRRLAG